MLTEIIEGFDKVRNDLLAKFSQEDFGASYKDLLKLTLEAIVEVSEDEYNMPDPSKITHINHGDYQGTIVFVIPQNGYQPSTYYLTKVGYGSCSSCDTLQRIQSEEDANERGKQYLTLALHMIQRMVMV